MLYFEAMIILNEIEHLRLLLYNVASDKNLTDPEVIKISQSLDRLLNDYQRLLQKSKNKQASEKIYSWV